MISVVMDGSTALADELELLGLPVSRWSVEKATRDVGFSVGAELAVLAFAPGRHPLLESESFRNTMLLYALADKHSGTVGPATASGSGPCPRCLTGAVPDSDGNSDLTLRWVAVNIAMEIETLRRHGVSTLFATSLTWSLGAEPGLTAAVYPRGVHCWTPGCID